MTDILKSFSTLQCELDVAKNTLKGVDENIKRLIGRDPSDVPARPTTKRNNYTQNEERGRSRNAVPQHDEKRFKTSRLRMFVQENEEPPAKKRTTGVSVFKRLSDRPIHDGNQPNVHKGMISKVIVTPKEVPSRQERMEAQSKDATSIARNRRMFGALLGTLQKFQQEETKLKKKEDKRAQLEKKIEEHEIKEKEEIKKERQELFFNRKKKQAEIKMIELKMIRMKEYATWEDSQKQRMNFIYTKTKPHIHYLPRKLKDAHKVLLESSRTEIQNLIDKKREQVQEELENIEERGKRIYESRKYQQESREQDNDDHENGIEDDAIMEYSHNEEKEENVEVKSNNHTDVLNNRTDGDCVETLQKNGLEEEQSLNTQNCEATVPSQEQDILSEQMEVMHHSKDVSEVEDYQNSDTNIKSVDSVENVETTSEKIVNEAEQSENNGLSEDASQF